MAIRLSRQDRIRAVVRSRILTMSLLGGACLVSLAVGREVGRRVSVQQEVDRLKAEIVEAEASTTDLEALIATLNSATFEEGAARTTLNLQKPGERVLVVPGSNAAANDSVKTNVTQSERITTDHQEESNTERWWDFLFPHRAG